MSTHPRGTPMRLALFALMVVLPATPTRAQQARPPLSETLERGTVVNSTFSNRYFGVELPLPPGWIALTDEEMAVLPGPFGQIFKAIRSGAPLSTLSFLPWATLVNANPLPAGATGPASILLGSTRFSPEAGRLPMLAFVEELRKELESSVPGQKVTVEQEQLAGRVMRYVDGIIGPRGLRQRRWMVQVRGQAVGIFGTYQNATQLDGIREVLKKLVIEGPFEEPNAITPPVAPTPSSSGIPAVESSPSGRTDVLERGGVVRGVYSNRFFGLRLPVPQGWRVLSEAEMASGPRDISESIRQLQAGVPLLKTPTVPLILMENRIGRANLSAMAIRSDPAFPLTLAAIESKAREAATAVPGERFSTGHDELSGQRIPYVDVPLPDGGHQREWVFLSRGYYVFLTGTYEGQAGLAQLRKVILGLGWTVR